MTWRSQRLREADLRQAHRLVGEVVELGRDPAAWRAHLLAESLRLIGGRVGVACEHFIDPADPARTRVTGLVDHGWAAGEAERFYAHLNAGGMVDDPLHAVAQRLTFRSYVRRRRDFVPDAVWYASPVTDPLRRACNVDDTIHTRWRLPQAGWAHALSLMKSWGEPPFSVRDRRVVNLVHRELGRLWARAEAGPFAPLPPRLRQTLDLLFSGYSEKEMARTLDVSPHTIHDFARRLYRQFGVDGRGSLLAHPACRRPLCCPALSPAHYADDRPPLPGTFPNPAAVALSPDTPVQGD